MMRFALLFAAFLLAAVPAMGRESAAITAAAPSALAPWKTCDVFFTGPAAGARSPVFRSVPVALRPEQVHTGLKVPLQSGTALMLFAWHGADFRAFWMKDVHRPLSIAFIGPDGAVLGIQQMQPETTAYHWPRAPIVAALEAPTPLFAEVGITRGSVIHTRNCFVPELKRFQFMLGGG